MTECCCDVFQNLKDYGYIIERFVDGFNPWPPTSVRITCGCPGCREIVISYCPFCGEKLDG